MFPDRRSMRCVSSGPPQPSKSCAFPPPARVSVGKHLKHALREWDKQREESPCGGAAARRELPKPPRPPSPRALPHTPHAPPAPPTAARVDKRPPLAASADLPGSASPSLALRRLPGPAHDTSLPLPLRLRLSPCAHARPARLRPTRTALRPPARGASRNGRWVPAEGYERRRLPSLLR